MIETKNVAKNTVFLTGGLVAQKVLSFIYFLFLARFLGKDAVGKYLYALSLMTAFSTLSDLGFQQVVIREVAKAKERAAVIVKNALAVRTVLSFFAAACLIIVAVATERDAVRLDLILFSSIIIIFDAVQITNYAVLRGFQNLKYEALGIIIGQVITIGSSAFIIFSGIPIQSLVLSLAAGSLWNAIYSGYFVAKSANSATKPKIDYAIIKMLALSAMPFALSAIFVKIYSSADSIMIGRLSGNAALAVYGVPYKFTFAFQFIPIALAAALYPTFTTLIAAREKEKAGKVFAGAFRYLGLIVMPLVAGIIILAGPLMTKLYGRSYAESAAVLGILAFALISAFLDFPVGALLNGAHRQNVQTFWMGVTVAVDIALNFILIPRFGAVGAAISAVVGNFILFAGGLAYIPKIISLRGKMIVMSLAKTVAASAIMALILFFCEPKTGLIAGVSLGVVVYAILIILFKEVGIEDWKTMRSLFIQKPDLAETPIETEI
jgi:O-antigen/teichoic acid export membrane protein